MEAELHLVESLQDANDLARWLGERRRVLAVDTETTGLDWWQDRLRLVQFGDEAHGWAVPWEQWGGLVVDLLPKYEGDITGHNVKFDMQFLDVNGVKVNWGRVRDTRTQAHLLDPNSRTGLKEATCRYVDPSAGVGQEILKEAFRKHKWDWATVPIDFEGYWAYACLDTVDTAHLDATLLPRVMADDGLARVYRLEMDVLPVLGAMERRGFQLNEEHIVTLKRECEDYLVRAKEHIRTQYGVENINSAKQLADALEAHGGVRLPRTTKGNPQTDEKTLKLIPHPLAKLVLDIREKDKVAKTYLTNFLNLSHEGRLHCSINPLGAKTGRMSISRPSLQNIPHTAALRNCFQASEGHSLVLSDFDQIEMRLLAHYAQDDALQAAFGKDVPFFVNVARQIYGEPDFAKGDERYTIVKSSMYGKAYGSGVQKFAETAGIPVGEARAFMARLDATYPGIPKFQRLMDKVGRERYAAEGLAYIRTYFGRMGQVDDPSYAYKLTNYLLQGTAADILKSKLVDIDRAGLGEYLVLPVHDEVICDVPDELVPDVARALPELMTEDGFAVPLTAGVDIVKHWGDKY